MEELPEEILREEIIGKLSPSTRRQLGRTSSKVRKNVVEQTKRDKVALIESLLLKNKFDFVALNDNIYETDPANWSTIHESISKKVQKFYDLFLVQFVTKMPPKDKTFFIAEIINSASNSHIVFDPNFKQDFIQNWVKAYNRYYPQIKTKPVFKELLEQLTYDQLVYINSNLS